MTPAQRKTLEGRLRALVVELTGKQARHIAPLRDEERDSKPDDDLAPHDEMGQVIASNLNRADAATLAKVRLALKRLKDDPDDFGNCQDCGDEIPFARLSALPYVDRCVDCQGKDDGRGRSSRKKLTDFV